MFNGVEFATNTVRGKILRRPTIMESNSITKFNLMKGKTLTFQGGGVDSMEEAPFSPASLRNS